MQNIDVREKINLAFKFFHRCHSQMKEVVLVCWSKNYNEENKNKEEHFTCKRKILMCPEKVAFQRHRLRE